MSFIGWMAIAGTLLLAMALSSAWIRRLPISTAAIYLGVGCALGPWGFDLLRIDLDANAAWVERLTEVAVILSLFIGGLRLRLPLRHLAWRAAYSLASITMLATIAGVALCAWLLFDFSPALATTTRSHSRADRSGPCELRDRRTLSRQGPPALRAIGRSRSQRRSGVSIRDARFAAACSHVFDYRACKVGWPSSAVGCSGWARPWLRTGTNGR